MWLGKTLKVIKHHRFLSSNKHEKIDEHQKINDEQKMKLDELGGRMPSMERSQTCPTKSNLVTDDGFYT